MTQDLKLSCYGIRLRQVQVSDAPFIVQERRSSRARLFLGETKNCIRAQCEWIEAQQKREGDYYFLCETLAGRPVGTISVYNIEGGKAEWGRFLISPVYNAALQSSYLFFNFCFDQLALQHLKCTVVATNMRARKLYEWVGHQKEAGTAPPVNIAGTQIDQVRYKIGCNDWRSSRSKVLEAAEQVTLVRPEMHSNQETYTVS